MSNNSVSKAAEAIRKVIGFKHGSSDTAKNNYTYVGVDEPSNGRFLYTLSQAQFDAAPKGRGNLIMNFADGVLYICDGNRAIDIKTATGGAVAASVYANDPAFTQRYARKGEYASQEAFNELQQLVQNIQIPDTAGLLSKIEADQLYASMSEIEKAFKKTVVENHEDGTQTTKKVDKFALASVVEELQKSVENKVDALEAGMHYVTNKELSSAVANASASKENIKKVLQESVADGSISVGRGEQGPAGKDGRNGRDGRDGDSAFEIARVLNPELENEAAFIASLKGERGERGEQGPQGERGADGLNGSNGVDGKSAYELALETGKAQKTVVNEDGTQSQVNMTEIEWLDYLKGADGEVGPQGPAGESVYAIAKKLNPELENEAAFIASLKGERGERGEQGIQGPRGEQGLRGEQGERGEDGLNGKNGKSAYEVALEAGLAQKTVMNEDGTESQVEMTKAEWLETLKGEKGEKGDMPSLDGYVKTEDLAGYVKTSELPAQKTLAELGGVTQAGVEAIIQSKNFLSSEAIKKMIDDAIAALNKNSNTHSDAPSNENNNTPAPASEPTDTPAPTPTPAEGSKMGDEIQPD